MVGGSSNLYLLATNNTCMHFFHEYMHENDKKNPMLGAYNITFLRGTIVVYCWQPSTHLSNFLAIKNTFMHFYDIQKHLCIFYDWLNIVEVVCTIL
jgi:hypothetical protein